jgi:hypothetical protein
MGNLSSLKAGGLLCRASLLASRSQGGHPAHLWLAQELLARAVQLAPNDTAIALFAAKVAIERLDLSAAEKWLAPFTKGRDALREAVALKGFLLEVQNDRERARATYLHLRVLRAPELAQDALARMDEHPALYAPASDDLLAYSSGSPELPMTQLAFLRAAERPSLLQKMIEQALPYEPPAKMEVMALIDELRRRVIRWNIARLAATALVYAPGTEEARQVAESLAKDNVEDRARAGGAALCRQGHGELAAQLLFQNESVSIDARSWAMAFSAKHATPYLPKIQEALRGEEIRFYKGVPALLGLLGEPGGALLVESIKASPEPHKALEPLAWLIYSGHPEAKPMLDAILLSRGVANYRRDGFEEVGRMGDASWVEMVEKRAHYEPDPEVRAEALLALFSLVGFAPEKVEAALSFSAEFDNDRELQSLMTQILQGKRVVR